MPSMVSGLPALPSATIRPSRIPTSAFTTPQWSSTTAPVITRSGVPSARVARDWPIDSRIDLPPPKTASSPPTQRSSSTSMNRLVSASLIRSPVVGPNEASYSLRSMSTIEPASALSAEPGHDAFAGDRNQLDLLDGARLEPHGPAGQHVEAEPPR